MKKIKVIREYEGVQDECPKCGMIITGSVSQVSYWMKVHQLSKKCIKEK